MFEQFGGFLEWLLIIYAPFWVTQIMRQRRNLQLTRVTFFMSQSGVVFISEMTWQTALFFYITGLFFKRLGLIFAYATIAQMVERLTCNEDVAGSIPAGGSLQGQTDCFSDYFWCGVMNIATCTGRFQSGQMGQTVNLLANAFGGSNPPLPT